MSETVAFGLKRRLTEFPPVLAPLKPATTRGSFDQEHPTILLRPGDIVEVETTTIGVLRNPVVAE